MMVHACEPPRTTAIPLVVKLGGSLSSSLPAIVPVLRSSGRPLLIVPGGGTYANAVRKAGLDDETAHWEAIAAMGEYGRSIASFGIPVTDRLAVPKQTAVFLPLRSMRARDPLPHSWDATSDTIAAWVAAELDLALVLLKSVDGIVTAGILQERVDSLQETDVVDPLFIPFVLEKHVNAFILNGSCQERLADYFLGIPVPGTRISTTF